MANLTRWEPFREMVSLREAMDRLFEESFTRPFGSLGPMAATLPLDVYDEKDEIVVEADLPGFKPEEVNVSVTGNTLTLRAETKAEREEKERDYHLHERRRAMVYRTITLPTPVNADQAKAEFENGTLILTLPKVEAAKPKSISIKAKK